MALDPSMPAAAAAPALFNAEALVIVLAGTVLATIARMGLRDCAAAARAAAMLVRGDFDEDANRTALARLAGMARRAGVRAMDGAMPPDPALAQAIEQLMRTASLDAMREVFEHAQAQRKALSERAALVFDLAAEAAPIFGLVGTLFAMTQIAPVGGDNASAVTFAAIATAVISSLYGVLTAHLICLPMSGAIARQMQRKEDARAALITWFAGEVSTRRPTLERVA